MKATIQAIFQRDFPEYARAHQLPLHVHKAARSIMRCRTAALGGHVMGCSNGHIAGVWYNSCRHRSCPQCAKLQIDRWLAGWQERLLPCDHYHVVFTLPHDLLELWQLNRKRLSDHLFRAARETIFQLLGDDKHLGGQPGMMAALHTWGRTLSLHPHLHCLITGGGLLPDGRWRSSHGGYLLPVRVVKALFRGKMMAFLRRDLDRGDLALPPGLSETALSNLQRRLYAKKWNVRLQERYPHGRGVILYLARYVRGGPIRDRRLLSSAGGAVTFAYQDHRDGRQKTLTLLRDEFMRRLLWHVPEPRSHVIRLYGLYGRQRGEVCDACRSQLLSRASKRPTASASTTESRERSCKICGLPVGCLEELAPGSVYLPRPELPKSLQSP